MITPADTPPVAPSQMPARDSAWYRAETEAAHAEVLQDLGRDLHSEQVMGGGQGRPTVKEQLQTHVSPPATPDLG